MAGRRYPASETRLGGREESTRFRGEGRQLGGATPFPRPGVAAGRSYPMPKARAVTGRRNPTPKARSGSSEEQPHIQGVVAVRAQEGLEDPSHVEGQQGQQEEIPFIQGKEQWLCFAGVAVKRYPTPKVRETQGRW